MIKIFNPKLEVEILIEQSEWVSFMPRDYEDIPNVILEFQNGFNFIAHAKICNDCKQFVKAFGTKNIEWYIKYNNKIMRLDLSDFSNKYNSNKINFTNSYYMYGSRLKLNIHELSLDKEEIQKYLDVLISNEKYEEACMVRDLTNLNPR